MLFFAIGITAQEGVISFKNRLKPENVYGTVFPNREDVLEEQIDQNLQSIDILIFQLSESLNKGKLTEGQLSLLQTIIQKAYPLLDKNQLVKNGRALFNLFNAYTDAKFNSLST